MGHLIPNTQKNVLFFLRIRGWLRECISFQQINFLQGIKVTGQQKLHDIVWPLLKETCIYLQYICIFDVRILYLLKSKNESDSPSKDIFFTNFDKHRPYLTDEIEMRTLVTRTIGQVVVPQPHIFGNPMLRCFRVFGCTGVKDHGWTETGPDNTSHHNDSNAKALADPFLREAILRHTTGWLFNMPPWKTCT